MGLFSSIGEARAVRHYNRAAHEDLSGRNHAVARIRLGAGAELAAILCICGEVFWASKAGKASMPKRESFPTEDSYVGALRLWSGIAVRDVSERKAHRVRGLGHKFNKKGDPGRWF